MEKIDRYVWSTCADGSTCPECKKLEGKEWKRKKDITVRTPLPACTSSDGCRCQVTPVYDDEGVVNLY